MGAQRPNLAKLFREAAQLTRTLGTPRRRSAAQVPDRDACEALLRVVNGPACPGRAPSRPPGVLARVGGGSWPRLPGSPPRIWSLPTRKASFTGRDGLLVQLRELRLRSEGASDAWRYVCIHAERAVERVGGGEVGHLQGDGREGDAGRGRSVGWSDHHVENGADSMPSSILTGPDRRRMLSTLGAKPP